ncbi:MAG: protein SCO1/2 [Ascidiaceihabitans sp.]
MIRSSLVALVFWASAAAAQSPFPLALGGNYTLTDQFDQARTEKDPAGHAQLLFFGYVNCPDICTAALPLMADVANALDAQGHKITPVMITIAPDQDTVETMGKPLAKWHPDFIGLTGGSNALQDAYKAFSVEIKPLFEDPEYGWIYAHGSFIHLLGGDGEILTLIPPTLGTDQVVSIVAKYLQPAS